MLFIREPSGRPLAEAGDYQEEIIMAVLDLERAVLAEKAKGLILQAVAHIAAID